ADEVAPVDALKTLRDDGFYSQQTRSLSSPITRRTGSIFLPSDDNERRFLFLIFHRRVIDTHSLRFGSRVRPVNSYATFSPRHHQILDAHIREGPTHHHFMVAAPRAIAIKIRNVNSFLLQVNTRGRCRFDRAGGTDVVRRY